MEEYTVFDIEGDSLTPTKIYCMTVERHKPNQPVEFVTLTDYTDMRKEMIDAKVLVGHNIILWDIPRIERILFDGLVNEREHKMAIRQEKLVPERINAKLIDTLTLSWYLQPERLIHGLDSYGNDYGIEKPKITSWTDQTLEEYIHRNREDVKINSLLFHDQIKQLEILYEGQDISGIIGYLMFKMDCAREQEEVGWKLDTVKAQSNIDMFDIEINKKTDLLSAAMPEVISYKEMNLPAKMYKIDGTLSKRGENWLNLLNDLGFPEDYSDSIKLETGRGPGNPGSFDQIKDWLYGLGWIPETYKYNKDKKTGAVTKVAQLSLPKSAGGGICPSIKKIYVNHPVLQELENLFVLRHRRSILRGFLRDVDEDGYLMAQISGLTNTLRFKHSTIVNLPGVTGKHKPEEGIFDWKDGVHIRGVLIAPEGYTLIGSDMSSIEDRTKQHYMYYFDPEYVKSMIIPGFDPHLDLAIFAGAITEQDAEFYKDLDERMSEGYKPTPEEKDRYNQIKKERSEHKTVNYAATYGSGADTMSKNSGMTVGRAKDLLTAYKKKNWSLQKIQRAVITKTIGTQMWLKNPVSGFWYSLRYEKDIFSTLNQGTAVYCFDTWTKEVRDAGVKICGQFHDELIPPVKIGQEEYTKNIIRNAIQSVNDILRLNRELDVSVQIGINYSKIH